MPPEISPGSFFSAPSRPTISSFSVTTALTLRLGQLGVFAQREGNIVVDVHRAEQRAVLEQHAEQLAYLVEASLRQLGEVLVVDPDRSAIRLEQPDQGLEEDRLAGTGRSKQDRYLAGGKREGHIRPNWLRTEGLRQPLDSYLNAHVVLPSHRRHREGLARRYKMTEFRCSRGDISGFDRSPNDSNRRMVYRAATASCCNDVDALRQRCLVARCPRQQHALPQRGHNACDRVRHGGTLRPSERVPRS